MISNNTSMPTTDDELQKNTVGELKPHNVICQPFFGHIFTEQYT